MELLAPAGGRESLLAALNNGADAVYLGGKAFNARQSADNFDLKELEEAVLLAHSVGAKIHLTLNTLLREEELAPALEYAAKLYELGVDALIVTDLGLIKLLRKELPRFPLHASTQLTIHEEEGALYLKKLGMERVVLARELSLSEIDVITAKGIETEVFVHGALCISYSGQCLFSSLIGGRSGNRGRCAQPCRLPYTLLDPKGEKRKAGYLLSPKDLSFLPALPELEKAGVTSLKIEGRMKRPEYVATVVRVYREALDNLKTGKPLPTEEELLAIFNRGFSRGYLYGNPMQDLMSYKRPNNRGVPLGRVRELGKGEVLIELTAPLTVGDGIEFWIGTGRSGTEVAEIHTEKHKQVKTASPGERVWVRGRGKIAIGDRVFLTADRKLQEQAQASFESSKPIPVAFTLTAKIGERASLLLEAQGFEVEVRGKAMAEEARRRALDQEIAARHLLKLGGTPFVPSALKLELEGELALPPSDLNQMRREALNELSRKIRKGRTLPQSFVAPKFQTREKKEGKPRLAVWAGEGLWQGALRAGADLIYLPVGLSDLDKALLAIEARGKKAVIVWPRISTTVQTESYYRLTKGYQSQLAGILLGHLGQMRLAQALNLPLFSDFGFNCTNSEALFLLKESGIKRATSSVELNLGQLRELSTHSPLPLELIFAGSLPLMVSRHCPVGSNAAGEKCAGLCSRQNPERIWYLEDRKNVRFPLVQDENCTTTLYNAHQLSVLRALPELLSLGFEVLRIQAPFGKPSPWEEVIRLHRRELDLAWDNPSYQPQDQLDDKLKALWQAPVTGGHFFRGVE